MSAPSEGVGPSRSAIQAAIITLLRAIVPAGLEIVEGYDNRVPEPIGPDFATLIVLGSSRLATNESTYSEGSRAVLTRQRYMAQIDVHGPASAENAAAIAMLLRDFYSATSSVVSFLFCDDPKFVPFENAEQQTEMRWVITAYFQVNQTLAIPQQSAKEATVTIYPPPT